MSDLFAPFADGLTPTPSDKQADAVSRALDLLERKRTVTISGPGGSGKSTVGRYLFRALQARHDVRMKKLDDGTRLKVGGVAVLGPTHRSCRVLKAKMPGSDPRTGHSYLFQVEEETVMVPVPGVNGTTSVPVSTGQFRFTPRDAVPHDAMLYDEGSMVGRKVGSVAESHDKPIVVMGDGCQLPPVGDEPAFDLEHADIELTEIFRQDGGALLEACNAVRRLGLTGNALRPPYLLHRASGMLRFAENYGLPTVPNLTSEKTGQELAAGGPNTHGAQIALVTTNRERRLTGYWARRHALGFGPSDWPLPQAGEKLTAFGQCGAHIRNADTVVVERAAPGPVLPRAAKGYGPVSFPTQLVQVVEPDSGMRQIALVLAHQWRYCHPAAEVVDEEVGIVTGRPQRDGRPNSRPEVVPPRSLASIQQAWQLELHDDSGVDARRVLRGDEPPEDFATVWDAVLAGRNRNVPILVAAPGWAQTVWTAQGGEWSSGILVAGPTYGPDAWKVLYTALSRFRTNVTVVEHRR